MALFGGLNSSGTGNGVGASGVTSFKDVLVASVAATALTASTQQIPLQPIANYYGLPSSRFNISITTSDVTGNTTAPVTVKGTSTSVYELQIYGKSGALIYDGKGQDNDFINDAHMLNPYGWYSAEVTGTETTTALTSSNTFSTILGLSVDAAEFPLTPVLTLNTQASRATTLYGMTSTVAVSIWMDFEAHTFVRAKLRSYNISSSATGVVPLQAFLDKNVNILSQAYYFAVDANLTGTQTISFANNGNQIINATPLSSFINKENQLAPSNPHITGFLPISYAAAGTFNSNFSTVLQFNVATAPTIGGVANVIKCKLLEAY